MDFQLCAQRALISLSLHPSHSLCNTESVFECIFFVFSLQIETSQWIIARFRRIALVKLLKQILKLNQICNEINGAAVTSTHTHIHVHVQITERITPRAMPIASERAATAAAVALKWARDVHLCSVDLIVGMRSIRSKYQQQSCVVVFSLLFARREMASKRASARGEFEKLL